MNIKLEIIGNRLDTYVETKRLAFPRFYFLSKEDLIQILSNSDDKAIISLHLKSLFDGIVSVDFKDDAVFSMRSKEAEIVELTKPVKTGRIDVEKWLFNLTEIMKETVSKALKTGQKAYTDDGRKDWVLQHPG